MQCQVVPPPSDHAYQNHIQCDSHAMIAGLVVCKLLLDCKTQPDVHPIRIHHMAPKVHDKPWYLSMHWQQEYCDLWCMLVAPAATCILFGDGCGAVVLSAAPEGESCSLLGMSMHSDGKGQKSLNAMYGGSGGKHTEDGSASGQASYRNISMAGQEVFKFAVRSVPQVRVLATRPVLHQLVRTCAWRCGQAYTSSSAALLLHVDVRPPLLGHH